KHADPEYDNALRDRFPGAVPIPLPLKGQRWRAVHLRRAAAITGRAQARSRGHPAVMREVARLLALGRFDAVVADGLSAWASIPRAPGLPVVVFPHNAE